ncbi:hypothetical protein FA15DRAFT_720442, partial [Coprinopsis marcescibilis]
RPLRKQESRCDLTEPASRDDSINVAVLASSITVMVPGGRRVKYNALKAELHQFSTHTQLSRPRYKVQTQKVTKSINLALSSLSVSIWHQLGVERLRQEARAKSPGRGEMGDRQTAAVDQWWLNPPNDWWRASSIKKKKRGFQRERTAMWRTECKVNTESKVCIGEDRLRSKYSNGLFVVDVNSSGVNQVKSQGWRYWSPGT